MYHKLQWPQEVLKCEPLSGLGNYTLAKRICDSESVLSTTPSRFYQAVFSRAPPSTIFRKCWERITNFHILTFVAQVPSWSSPSLVEVMKPTVSTTCTISLKFSYSTANIARGPNFSEVLFALLTFVCVVVDHSSVRHFDKSFFIFWSWW